VKGSATIVKEDWLLQDGSDDPRYEGYPLRTFAGQKYLGGYSDHLPIYIQIALAK